MKRLISGLLLALILVTLLVPVMPVAAATVLSEVMPDANLRQAVLDRLKVTIGDVELSRMQDILSLDASGFGVKDITGLEFCVNLVRLDLSNNQIEDVSTLAKLYSETSGTKLRELNLANNRISDVAPLKDLGELDVLNLSGNLISDLSPFYRESGGYSVPVINLSSNQISDVAPLVSLNQISVLHLADNQINDIAALVPCVGFGVGDVVNLYDNPLSQATIDSDVAALKDKWVSVYYGQTPTPEAVGTTPGETETPQIDTVTFAGPLNDAIRNLLARPYGDIMACEPGLFTALDLSNIGLTTLDGLELCCNLRYVNLSGNQITDIGRLLEIETLETVVLTDNPLSETSISDYIKQLEAGGVKVSYQEPPSEAQPETPTTPETSEPTTEPELPIDTGAPVGAIVGGVIGGLAVIGGAAFWWFRKRPGSTTADS